MLRRQSGELAMQMAAFEAQAHELAGQPFNLGSPIQIQEILYGRLQLPVSFKTPTGQPSTGEEALQELAEHHPLPQLILDYRGLSKLKSTYTDRLPEQINPRTGRVHTCYHQAVAATGRLSSSDPNLQNIPIRSAEGRRIRLAFIAPPGHVIMAADVREHGYVETVFGRRLYLPDINARQAQRRQYAERAAINAPMQGTAADIIKRAMIRTDGWLHESGVAAKMIMQVHDELVFEVAADAVAEASVGIRECMTTAAALAVPLVVDLGVGANWQEAH